jgi:hypothetical protein
VAVAGDDEPRVDAGLEELLNRRRHRDNGLPPADDKDAIVLVEGIRRLPGEQPAILDGERALDEDSGVSRPNGGREEGGDRLSAFGVLGCQEVSPLTRGSPQERFTWRTPPHRC